MIFVMVRSEHASSISQLFPADLEARTLKMMLEGGHVSVIVFKLSDETVPWCLKQFLFSLSFLY